MKFTWGTGILLFYAFFATSMTFAVVATTKHSPQLVQQDYYALDLNYQDRLTKKQNAATLAAAPAAAFDAAAGAIRVQLPEGMTARQGQVKVYRSTTAQDDFSLPLDNASALDIPAARLAPGRWHVELDWTAADGKAYFWETAVFVNVR